MRNKYVKLFMLFLLFVAAIGKQTLAQQPYSFPTTIANPLYVAYARVDTGLFNVPNMISTAVARTLTSAESGSTVLVTTGSGITLTLPAPTVGLTFEVIATTTATAGSMIVITDAGTTFLAGGVTIVTTSGTGSQTFSCNGTSHIKISSNGTTSGWAIGSRLFFRAVSTTLWEVLGIMPGSSTPVVTPCST